MLNRLLVASSAMALALAICLLTGTGTPRSATTWGGQSGASAATRVDAVTTTSPAAYSMSWRHLGSGGGVMSGAGYNARATAGQPAIGHSASAGYASAAGYIAGALGSSDTEEAPCWLSPTSYSVLSNPSSVLAVDVNHDGNADVITALPGRNSFSVRLSNGDGTLGAEYEYACGLGSTAIAASDFNGDTHIDLAVVNQTGQNVAIELNNGLGQFQWQQGYATGVSPIAIVVADFDGDADPDLAIANQDWTVSLLINTGGGVFAPRVDYPTGQDTPTAIACADFDGDEDVDLAISKDLEGTVFVLMNDGDGTFGNSADYNTGMVLLTALLAADFDGDLDSDLAVGSATGLLVLANDGAGAFLPGTAYVFSASSMCCADLNRDGDIDILATSYGTSVALLRNQGNGDFFSLIEYTGSEQLLLVCTGSVDGDTLSDIVAASIGGSALDLFMDCQEGSCNCPYPCDLNGDTFVDATDLAFVIDIVFFGGTDVSDPDCPVSRADFDANGFADATDLAFLIDHVFFGGGGPVDPCGN